MLRSTWRSVTRDPGFTATAVLTLALGIGANTAMFSVVDGALLKPLAYREPERLVSLGVGLGARSKARFKATFSGMTRLLHRSVYNHWRDHADSLESIALIGPGTVNLAGAGQPERLLTAWISSSLFSTLGVRPALGRAFAADEDLYHRAHVAILSHGLWRRRFGADPAILGRKILLNEEPYEVIAVMSPGFELPIDSADASRFDILLPADPEKTSVYQGWECVARLKPGVTVDQSRVELDAILAHEDKDNWVIRLAIVSRLQNNLTARVKRGLSLLMSAVGLVLLIACANLASLLLGRGLTRRKELAIRAALGASRRRIMGQVFRESLGLSLLGGAAAVLGAAWILAAILTQLPQELPHRGAISVDARALAFSLAVSILCALLVAALPAWRFSKADPQEALGQSQRGASQTRGSELLRRWLIAAQVALCTMLLIGTGLLLRSFAKILALDGGFETEHVLTAEVPFPIIVRNHLAIFRWDDENIGASALRRIATYRAIEERLAATPGISAAGAVSLLPLSGVRDDYWWPIFLPNEKETPATPFAQIRIASPGYFHAAGIALRSGRLFSGTDRWMAVVSESAAMQRWPGQDPIGQQFSMSSSHPRIGRVAGVVADVRQTELQDPSPPTLYLPPESNLAADLSFVIRTGLPVGSAAQAIRRAVWQVDPNLPVASIRPMSEIFAASTAQRRFQILLLASFAGVAVLLAALGIYGTLSYSVNQRYREIGIRLALGAQGRDIRALVLRQALRPVGLGLAAGCGGALLLMRTLASLLYGVGFGDAVSYSAASALVLAVALVSSWLPARRAMRLDPVETIRCE